MDGEAKDDLPASSSQVCLYEKCLYFLLGHNIHWCCRRRVIFGYISISYSHVRSIMIARNEYHVYTQAKSDKSHIITGNGTSEFLSP